jgi:chemotaxis family two-component system response regulator Rcp1
VLLVEDNPTDAFVIKWVVEECGLDFRIRIMSDGQDALTYLQELERDKTVPCPALVILDLNLPKVSGLEVLQKLRGESRCRNTPVIVVSSSSAESDRRNSRALGAEEYFEKPNDLDAYAALGKIIKRMLRLDGKGQ